MNARRWLLVALVVLALLPLLLQGCAANPVGWNDSPTHAPLPAVFRVSSLGEIQSACPNTPQAIGCAVRDYGRGICLVLVPADAPLWLLSHELLHCAGVSHA